MHRERHAWKRKETCRRHMMCLHLRARRRMVHRPWRLRRNSRKSRRTRHRINQNQEKIIALNVTEGSNRGKIETRLQDFQ